MTKLKFDLRNGLIEVEADAELAAKIYNDFKDPLLDQLKRPFEPPHGLGGKPIIIPEITAAAAKKRAATAKGGPSCAERITDLKKEGFFKELRDLAAISKALSEKAQNYQSNQIAAALTSLTKRNELRRISKDGGYKYQNP